MNKCWGKRPSEKILKQLYCLELKPMHAIAKELGIAIGSVYNYLHKYGLPTRPQKETFTMRGQKLSKEQCLVISKREKGKVLSSETKSKISEAHKGVYSNKSKYGGHRKERSDGYIKIYLPTHPLATKGGYVMEHILVMEEFVGKIITRDQVVHHVNKIRNDNRISNLLLMTFKEHASFHMKERQNKRRNDLLINQF